MRITPSLATMSIIVSMSTISCREPSSGSSLRTLDNIASAKPIFEACSGQGDVHAKAKLGDQPHLKSALAAVPMTIQNGFFDDLGGKIRVVSDASLKDCSVNNARIDDGLSCWRRLPDEKSSVEIIIRKSSASMEQYALVRAFGFVYGDLLMNRVIPGSIASPVTISERPSGHLRDYKAHLASIFLGDLMASLPADQRKDAVSSLEKLGIPKSVATESDFAKRWGLFTALPSTVQDGFSSRVFAEAFHSQFCTRASADRACKLFGNTMRSFAPYAQDVTSKTWMDHHQCAENRLGLGDSQLRASSSRREWFNQHADALTLRRNSGSENGSLVNSRIAEAAQAAKGNFNLGESAEGMNLNGDILSTLQSLLTGGLSLGGGGGGGGGGLGGLMNQILGGLQGGGGIGGLSGILSSLGLGLPSANDLGGSLGGGGGAGGGGAGGGGNGPGPIENNQPSNVPSNQGTNNSAPLPSSGGGIASAQEQAAIDATNRYRQSQGKQPLQTDEQMIADCRKQAQAQVGAGLQHWLHPAGIARGENIAYGSTSGEHTVMQQWVKSPPHHANILGNYRYIGIGNVGNQWCQRFR